MRNEGTDVYTVWIQRYLLCNTPLKPVFPLLYRRLEICQLNNKCSNPALSCSLGLRVWISPDHCSFIHYIFNLDSSSRNYLSGCVLKDLLSAEISSVSSVVPSLLSTLLDLRTFRISCNRFCSTFFASGLPRCLQHDFLSLANFDSDGEQVRVVGIPWPYSYWTKRSVLPCCSNVCSRQHSYCSVSRAPFTWLRLQFNQRGAPNLSLYRAILKRFDSDSLYTLRTIGVSQRPCTTTLIRPASTIWKSIAFISSLDDVH